MRLRVTKGFPWFLIVFCVFFLNIKGFTLDKQEKVEWLKKNGIPLRTLEPTDEDFSDLMPLVKKIGDARLVMLGEQSHGDGTTFLVKCRLVRFLHQVMDFDVLAWESGLYDCRKMGEALHTDMPLDEAVSHGVFRVWKWSEQTQSVFRYARSTHDKPRPLIMAGFDCQFSSDKSKETFSDDLRRFLEQAELLEKAPPVWDHIDNIFNPKKLKNVSVNMYNKHDRNIVKLIQFIALSRTQLAKVHSAREISFWLRVLSNYRVYYTNRVFMANRKWPESWSSNNRDKAMAETLHWLMEKGHPNRKIIVWAATLHNLRRAREIEYGDSFIYKDRITMGQPVYEKLGDAVYSIGFTAYRGKYGNILKRKTTTIQKPGGSTFEGLLQATGEKLLFVDFKSLRDEPGHWLNQPLKSHALGYYMVRAIWPRQMDAMIFTDTMSPSTRIQEKE